MDLKPKMKRLKEICRKNNVAMLGVFGSVSRGEDTAESDIDLVVDFNPIDISIYAENYYNLKFSLQSILNRPIDLLEDNAIKNPYFRQNLNETRKLIYGH